MTDESWDALYAKAAEPGFESDADTVFFARIKHLPVDDQLDKVREYMRVRLDLAYTPSFVSWAVEAGALLDKQGKPWRRT